MAFDQIVSGVLWDANGNPYQLTASGKKSYMTPDYAIATYRDDPKVAAWAQSHGASLTPHTPSADNPSSFAFQSSRPAGSFMGQSVWNPETARWETHFDWNSPLGQLLQGGMFFAGDTIGSQFAGPASGAGGDGSIPAEFGQNAVDTVNSAAPAAGTLSSTPIDAGLFTAPTSTPSGAVSSALADATNPLVGGLTSPVVKKAIAALSSAFVGHEISKNAMNGAVPPQLSQLLDLSVQRQKELAPLGTAATAGMYQMLPDFAKTPPSMQGAQSLLGVK